MSVVRSNMAQVTPQQLAIKVAYEANVVPQHYAVVDHILLPTLTVEIKGGNYLMMIIQLQILVNMFIMICWV
jgi:hypothetical protein